MAGKCQHFSQLFFWLGLTGGLIAALGTSPLSAATWGEIHEGIARWNREPSQPDLERLSALIAVEIQDKTEAEQKDLLALLRREFTVRFTTFAARYRDDTWKKKLDAWSAILLNEEKKQSSFMLELGLWTMTEFLLSLGPGPQGEESSGLPTTGPIPVGALSFDRSNGDSIEVMIDANDYFKARAEVLKAIAVAIERFLIRSYIPGPGSEAMKKKALHLLALSGQREVYLANRQRGSLSPEEEIADLLLLLPTKTGHELRVTLTALPEDTRAKLYGEGVREAYEQCQALAPLPLDLELSCDTTYHHRLEENLKIIAGVMRKEENNTAWSVVLRVTLQSLQLFQTERCEGDRKTLVAEVEKLPLPENLLSFTNWFNSKLLSTEKLCLPLPGTPTPGTEEEGKRN